MSKRWSKLQSRLYHLMDPQVGFQIHCALYEMNSNDGRHTYKLPRYFITINQEIVFDYPKDFDTKKSYNETVYPWITDIGAISDVIEEYIQCPKSKLMNNFRNDKWGLTDILRVCDRRIGKRKLLELQSSTTNELLLGIIKRRLHDGRTN